MQPGIQFQSSYRSTTYALERASDQVGLCRLKHGLQGQLIGAQFCGRKNPKNTCREKRDLKPDEIIPVFLCPLVHVVVTRAELKKRRLAQLSNYEDKRKGVSQVQRAVVQHTTVKVRHEK